MKIKIHVWRQKSADDKGHMESHDLDGLTPDMSFLEMLDSLNEKLTAETQNRLHSITIAARASVEVVRWWSMARPMTRAVKRPPASCT